MDISSFNYHILGEVVSCFFSLILGFNVLTTFSSYDKRQRLFLFGIAGAFLASLTDVISVILQSYAGEIPVSANVVATTLFFITLLAVPASISAYTLEIALDNQHHKKIAHIIVWSIYSAYIAIVIINLFTGWLFLYQEDGTYIRGPLKNITYILTLVYMSILEITTFTHKKNLAPRLFLCFVLYPIVSISILAIQFKFPSVVMTGSASFAGLLLAYLTIQSDMLEYDMVTGLMTENRLKKIIENKNDSMCLYVLTIDNMSQIQNNMANSDFGQLQLDIGREFDERFERNAYHISTNRYAALDTKIEALQKKASEINQFLSLKHYDTNLKISAKLEFYSAIIDVSDTTESKTNSYKKENADDKQRSYNDTMEAVNNMLKKAKLDGIHEPIICDETALLTMKRKNIIYEILKRELNPESKQFQVWFQPIYSISGQKFTYMEALSRLRGTELGDISPGEFVEVAEERGLIEKLGFIAFTKVCQFIADNQNLVHGVSINFSGYQMLNPNIVDIVLNTIQQYQIPPSSIIMEITESIFIENSNLVSENMKKLASAGVRFYLDDFGTGYSNLANVIDLNFSTIKMDRTLVLMLERNERNLMFFMNIVNTFKNAGFKILTEGVETQSQAELVKSAGTDYIQGFLYSKPLPPDECLAVLKKQQANTN